MSWGPGDPPWDPPETPLGDRDSLLGGARDSLLGGDRDSLLGDSLPVWATDTGETEILCRSHFGSKILELRRSKFSVLLGAQGLQILCSVEVMSVPSILLPRTVFKEVVTDYMTPRDPIVPARAGFQPPPKPNSRASCPSVRGQCAQLNHPQ